MASLQSIFNRILVGEVVKVEHFDRADYDSFVVSIRRKLRVLEKTLDEIGGDSPYKDQYIKCSFDRELVTGTYQLASKESRPTVRKNYVTLI